MITNARTVSRLRYLLWLHPETWLLALTGIAWVALMFESQAHHHDAAASSLWHAVVMTVAMMGPLAIVPLRTATFRSFWRMRYVAGACVAAGYLGTWLTFALIGRAVWVGIQPAISAAATTAVILAVAAAWQLTTAKAVALRRCHPSMPLAPSGWRAERDCTRLGILAATRCAYVTWPVMLVAVIAPDRLLVMAAVTALCAVERYTLVVRRHPGTVGALLGIAAVVSAAASLYS